VFLMFLSCEKGNLPPAAVLDVYPSIGDTTLAFEFNAGETTDDRNFALAMLFRWDFNGDGIWDTDYSKFSSIAHQFNEVGNYNAAVEVKDLDGLTIIARDSVVVFGKNLEIDTLCDNRDGNKYKIVKIGGQWWMGENLRFGMVIPLDREQTDNDTVEMYLVTQCQYTDPVGGIYSWLESKNYNVNDPKGVCPDGWHLPTSLEWEKLMTPYPPLYSLQYYSKRGLSNLNLDLNNGGIRRNGIFEDRCMGSAWESGFWSSSYKLENQAYLPYWCSFSSGDHDLIYGYWADSGLLRYYSVRCVKDNK
jgi:uncharacterized protein (TIGR02145 family)